jgi:hypothetical protein
MHAQLAQEMARHNWKGLKKTARKIPITETAGKMAARCKQWRWLGLHSREHTPDDVLH